MTNPEKFLLLILIVAFLVRWPGISYGLPFRINGDEGSAVYGALKMMELKTIIPALHAEEFKEVLSYSPYLSYLYLPFFSFLILLEFLRFFFLGGGFYNIIEFKNFVMSDAPRFFALARLLNVLLALIILYLVYRTSKNIFKNKYPALLSSVFLAFSVLFINVSYFVRHWIPAALLFTAIMYVLSHSEYSSKKKYILSLFLAGLGVGFNYLAGISIFFIFLWFIFYDKLSLKEYLKERWFCGAIILFLSLSFLAIILYPNTVGFEVNTVGKYLSPSSFFEFYKFYFMEMLKTEPGFLFFIITGFVFSFLNKRGYFFTTALFCVFYVSFISFAFHILIGRYIIILYPLFAIMAGYGFYEISKKIFLKFNFFAVYILTFVVFFPILLTAVKLDYLLLRNDTRAQVLKWLNTSISSDVKIATLAPFMRVPPLKSAIEEQRIIDAASLRKVDFAELALNERFLIGSRYHSLNLYTVNNREFFKNMALYLKTNNYSYLIFNEEFAATKNILGSVDGLAENVLVFKGFGNVNDFTNIINDATLDYGGGLKNIIELKNNGPDIYVVKIK